ncbi:alkyl sulfatase dimerization domain-containing protein [Streptomyces sp. NPDC018026]|uniref:alkyl sulfatase dimerization domain-containing protein n=1 Tax=Streptomyces sp. NPDC018026 TaxID=3365031 RepID=UPI0037B74260
MRRRARHYSDRGDVRFAVTLLNHAVFHDPDDTRAKRQLAALYVRLGRAAENAVWRNFYLTGAQELVHGVEPVPKPTTGPDLQRALTVGQLIDGLAVRVNGPEAWSLRLAVDWHIGDAYWHLRPVGPGQAGSPLPRGHPVSERGTGGLPRPVTRQSARGGHRTVVTRCSARAAQLEPVIWTLTLAMLPPQSTQWALP